MITLTYPADFPVNGRQFKRDLDRFGKLMLQHHVMPASILWVMEFQERGAPHFHLFSPTFVDHRAVAWLWAWAASADRRSGTSVIKVENARYALKYSQKEKQKMVPSEILSPGRFWGVWGDNSTHPLVEATTVPIDREMAPIERKLEQDRATNDGLTVWEHTYGFLAFRRFPHG